ncbi:MAG: hypothetical protein H6Q14_411 [Bacteroidetes bacterium]|jgi:hypothetical protein|nr:hypothetical protein [Bacteroidota bacterium]
MKRIFAIACLTFSFATFTQAQGLAKILKAFQENPAVIHQTVGKELLGMTLSQKDSISQNKPEDLIQKISNVDIYALKDCKDKNVGDILQAIDEYKDGEGYETLLTVNKDGKNVRIVVHKDSENNTEITILARTEDKIALVKLVGALGIEDIQKIINEQSDKL